MVQTYHRPSRIEDAFKLLKDDTLKNVPLAGGTTLALNPRGVDGLVDLAGLGLSYIRKSEKGSLQIGATTPIREIQRSEWVRQFAHGVLAESAKNYLTALIRNRATLGGVLSAGNFWADMVAVLVALNATVKIWSAANQTTSISVEEFVQKGPRKSLAGGIVHEIEIPACESKCQCVYGRLAKVETDISILSVAAQVTLTNRSVQYARLVVGNGSRPVRLKGAEEKIRSLSAAAAGEIAARAALEIPADSDIRASAEYRREVAAVLVRRLFQNLQ